MKIIIIVSLFVFCYHNTVAQSNAKTVFFELGGPGVASINYDMRLSGKDDGIGFRVGIGGYSISNGSSDKTSALFIPAGVNYLLGKDGKNFFEFGGGITFVSLSEQSSYNGDGTFSTSFGHLNFGYRLQPKNGGFLFRAGIVPIFNKYGFIPYYAGVSFGYKF